MKLNIVIDGKKYEVEVDLPEAGGHGGYVPPYAPVAQHVSIPSAPAPSNGTGAAGDSGATNVCRSPMAGVVVKVVAQPGQEIQKDDQLLVLEAMKMETNVTAPVAGKVKQVNVSAGDSVQVNQVLVEFE